MDNLSLGAKSLWAKKSSENTLLWLPLVVHMADSAAVARSLWNNWLPEGPKQAISVGIGRLECAEQLLVFLAAAHDIGKATPVFQAKQARPLCPELDDRINEKLTLAGVPMAHYLQFSKTDRISHAYATQMLLEQEGCNQNAAIVLGAHHGKPVESERASRSIGAYRFSFHLETKGREIWTGLQKELIAYAVKLANFSTIDEVPVLDMAAQVLLSGLLIMTDWIASNQELFPYMRLEDTLTGIDLIERGRSGWGSFSLSTPWVAGNDWENNPDLYKDRFEFEKPVEIQSAILNTAKEILSPGIIILEAPMGSGKTEAALAVAEAFADRANRSGVFFALPTQATSDGIFPRMLEWFGRLESVDNNTIKLAHGRAEFNEEYVGLKLPRGSQQIAVDNNSGVIVHEWFEGKKKSLLADFVVGTVDQLLLAALKQKHVMLRHLGLANKVVIIDECHAYDAYMSRYLDMILRWLGKYGVPVIVLSATLPMQKRRELILAYLNKELRPPSNPDPLGKGPKFTAEPQPEWMTCRHYPLLTYTDGGEVSHVAVSTANVDELTVAIQSLEEAVLVDKLTEILSDGGCAGIIVNTVKRAQEIAQKLREHFGQDIVWLLHSRFLAPDRIKKEKSLLQELGKPRKDYPRPPLRIVVGTQVLEQSLDIDFDVLITDLCPMDLMLQRIGRLHRHGRERPEKLKDAVCFVMGTEGEEFEPGAKAVYGDYLLMRTKAMLPQQVTLPDLIPDLVQNVYDESVLLHPEPANYQKAKARWHKKIKEKETAAGVFRIGPPWPGPAHNIADWLEKNISEQKGKAAVRDTDESIEVLLIQEREGKLGLFGWTNDGPELLDYQVPDELLAKEMARQRILLPNVLTGPWIIAQTISELERGNERLLAWQESPWLRGELFVVLDENCSTVIGDYKLIYDRENGLRHEKEVEESA